MMISTIILLWFFQQDIDREDLATELICAITQDYADKILFASGDIVLNHEPIINDQNFLVLE